MSVEIREAKPREDAPHKVLDDDVFGNEEGHQICYKTMSWQFVAMLMIAEIVSVGMLTLPSALAIVGIFPAVLLIIFLGIFGLFTAKLLVDFKLNHPHVHTMGDAGMMLFGPVGREILSLGSIVFSIFGVGAGIISGQQALSTLSNNGLCAVHFALIFAAAAFLLSLPRTLGNLTWLGVVSCACILVAGIVAMIGSGRNPLPGRKLHAFESPKFPEAFLAITNPVFAYAGHFMFFILISEMKRPQDAMKAVWVLQGFATVFYTIFAIVCYVYVGTTIESLSFLSLPPIWAKVAFGIAIPNILVISGLYLHVPAKLVFVRLFRHSKHVHSHTYLGWLTWIGLCFSGATVAYLFAVAVPIFSFLTGLAAALFASWYTYGIAGFFWLYDAHYIGRGIRAQPYMAILSLLTILAGAFICIAGTYVFIKTLMPLGLFRNLLRADDSDTRVDA